MQWTTKNGCKIAIKDMTTAHIKNAIDCLEREGFISRSTLHFYLTCSPPNGDMAQCSFEEEQDMVFGSSVSPCLDALEDELEKRHRNNHSES